MPELERIFFDYLDDQVDEAEMFFDERYREAGVRLGALKEQFSELAQHRRAYDVRQRHAVPRLYPC